MPATQSQPWLAGAGFVPSLCEAQSGSEAWQAPEAKRWHPWQSRGLLLGQAQPRASQEQSPKTLVTPLGWRAELLGDAHGIWVNNECDGSSWVLPASRRVRVCVCGVVAVPR